MTENEREKDKLSDAPLDKFLKNQTELKKVLYPEASTIKGEEDKPDADFIWKTKVNMKLSELSGLSESLRVSIFHEDLDVFYERVDNYLAEVKGLEDLLQEED